MFPRRYYPGRMFAPRYFPQSAGEVVETPVVPREQEPAVCGLVSRSADCGKVSRSGDCGQVSRSAEWGY